MSEPSEVEVAAWNVEPFPGERARRLAKCTGLPIAQFRWISDRAADESDTRIANELAERFGWLSRRRR